MPLHMIFRQTEEIFDGMDNAPVVLKSAVVQAEGLMKFGTDNAGHINFICSFAQRSKRQIQSAVCCFHFPGLQDVAELKPRSRKAGNLPVRPEAVFIKIFTVVNHIPAEIEG